MIKRLISNRKATVQPVALKGNKAPHRMEAVYYRGVYTRYYVKLGTTVTPHTATAAAASWSRSYHMSAVVGTEWCCGVKKKSIEMDTRAVLLASTACTNLATVRYLR